MVKCQNFTFTYYIAVFQTLKRNYAVNGHEMYCTFVFCDLCATHNHMDTYSHRVTNSKTLTKCNVTLLFYCTLSNENEIFNDLTMTTNDLNMPY